MTAEDELRKAMATVFTSGAYLEPIVAAFEAALGSEPYFQQLPHEHLVALQTLLTTYLIPARFQEMTTKVKSDLECMFYSVISGIHPVSNLDPDDIDDIATGVNLLLGPKIKECMVRNVWNYFIRRPLVVPETINEAMFEDRERQKSLVLEKQRVLQSVCLIVANSTTMLSSNAHFASDDAAQLFNIMTVQGRMHLASSLNSSGSSTSSVSQAGFALDEEDPTIDQTDSISPAHSPATSTSEPDSFVQV